jgi:hypothetical protein
MFHNHKKLFDELMDDRRGSPTEQRKIKIKKKKIKNLNSCFK